MDRLLLSEKSYLYSHSPINTGLCLFIWPQDPLCASVAHVILDDKLKDCENVAVTCTSYRAMNEAFPDYIDDERIKFLIPDSDEYVRCMFTAEEIYTGEFLPSFYRKRREQRLIGVFHRDQMDTDRYSKNGLVSHVRTLSSLDEYIDAQTAFRGVSEGDGTKVVIAVDMFDEFTVDDFIIMDSRIGEARENSDAEVVYYLPFKLWNRLINDHIDDKLFGRILSPLTDIRDVVSKNDLLITDSHILAEILTDEGVICAALADSEDKGSYAWTWRLPEDIYDIIDEYSSSDKPVYRIADTEPLSKGSVNMTDNGGERILVVASWDDLKNYTHRFSNIEQNAKRSGKEIQILFRDPELGDIQNTLSGTERSLDIAIRTGRYQPDEQVREIVSESEPGDDIKDPDLVKKVAGIMEEEWSRILGNNRYGEIWATYADDFFWEQMYLTSPAEKIDVISHDELMDRLMPLMRPVEKDDVDPTTEVTIDSREMISLGHRDDEEFYLSKELVDGLYAFTEYSEKNVNILKHWEKSAERCSKLIVLNRSKKALPIDLKEECVEIRSEIIPFDLIAGCTCYLGGSDTLAGSIAQCLGKEIIGNASSGGDIDNKAFIKAYGNDVESCLCISGLPRDRF